MATPIYPPSPSTISPYQSARPSFLPPEFQVIDKTGKVVLWVAFTIFFLSFLIFTFLAWRAPIHKRLLPLITVIFTLLATITYYAFATGSGSSLRYPRPGRPDPPHPGHRIIIRQVFWARYLEALFASPLILLDLAFLASLPGANVVALVVADLVCVGTGWLAIGAVSVKQRAGYSVFSALGYLTILYILVLPCRRAALARSAGVGKLFTSLAVYTLIVWLCYPIITAIAAHTTALTVTGEVVAYAILDLLAKVVFGFWLLWGVAKEPRCGVLVGGEWVEGVGYREEGGLRVGGEE
ncbi:MAG: hypothetical protein M1839_005838 [Geoglossum umbratile]|nr:MAG: hypothetical protein M1839_005838 [Geoglossum umbratile]